MPICCVTFLFTKAEFPTGHFKGRKIYFWITISEETDRRQAGRQTESNMVGKTHVRKFPHHDVESSGQNQKWVSPSRLAQCDSLLALPYVPKGSHKLPKEYHHLRTKCLNTWAYGGISHLYCSRGLRLKGTTKTKCWGQHPKTPWKQWGITVVFVSRQDFRLWTAGQTPSNGWHLV